MLNHTPTAKTFLRLFGKKGSQGSVSHAQPTQLCQFLVPSTTWAPPAGCAENRRLDAWPSAQWPEEPTKLQPEFSFTQQKTPTPAGGGLVAVSGSLLCASVTTLEPSWKREQNTSQDYMSILWCLSFSL